MTTTVEIPVHLEDYARREIADGLIEYEAAPVGWAMANGEPRRKPWRAYQWTPTDGKRVRLPSVTTFLDSICPKGGMPRWAEAKGIEGLARGIREGLIGTHDQPVPAPAEAVTLVRDLGLGMEGSRDKAATRGVNVHALMQAYMETGEAPKVFDHPEEQRGYIKALCRWLIKANPEPVAVEQLVCHPEDGYAGRLDLRARIGGRLTTIDLKTQERGQIFRAAHIQVACYERAAVRCGEEPAEELLVVALAANGEPRPMPANHPPDLVESALNFYFACKPVDQVCESANRAERRARAAA